MAEAMGDILPFAGEDGKLDWEFGSNNVFAPRNMKMTKKKKKAKANEDYYKGRTSSKVAPPDEPLNILMINDAAIYKVDGSNSIESVAGLENVQKVIVLGSCNGLVALYRHHGEFILFNPDTGKQNLVKVNIGEWNKTYYSYNEYHLVGLCHDSDNDEYKAVLFDVKDRWYNVVNFKHRDRSVRKTQLGLPHFTSFPLGPIGTVVKGVPYWVCRVNPTYLIYYFDSKTEEFLMGPNLPIPNRVCGLGTLDGKLIASHTCYYAGTTFWALDDETSKCCYWTLLFVFPERAEWTTFSSLSWMMSQVELLVCEGDNRLMVFNVRDKSMRLLSKSFQTWMYERERTHGLRYYIVAYTPSLIDPSI